ncbi:MAG: hypothetical protein NTZ25_03215 [Candidatus Peregrinibacteria bacterium]|nr:hypothetical protein [Candidatus Peregrinibacteria bacterium]
MAKKKIQLEAKVDQILKKMDQKFDSIDQKLESMDKRFDDLASVLADFNYKTNNRIDYLALHMKEEFDTVHQRFDSMLSKKEFYEWTYKYDDLLQEMRDARQNRLLFEKQFVDLDDTVAQHENRIKKLEHKARA